MLLNHALCVPYHKPNVLCCAEFIALLSQTSTFTAADVRYYLQTLLTTKSTDPRFDWSVFENITFTDAESTGIEDKDRAFIKKYRKPVGGLHSLTLGYHCLPPHAIPNLSLNQDLLSHAHVGKQ